MAENKDDILKQWITDGSIDSYQLLFKEYYKPLCSFAEKYVLELTISEDIVQELFVKIWEQRATIQLETSIRSYLFQSVRNECLNFLKHQGVKEKYKKHIIYASTDKFYDDKLIEEEINQLVYKTIQSLPPRCKEIFELSRFEGKTFEEISIELSLSKNTIKNQLVTALKKIKEVLEKNEIVFLIAILSSLLYR